MIIPVLLRAHLPGGLPARALLAAAMLLLTLPARAQPTDCASRLQVVQAGIATVDASTASLRMRSSAGLSGCKIAGISIVIRWPRLDPGPLAISSLVNGSGMPPGLSWSVLDTATDGGFEYAQLAAIPGLPPDAGFSAGDVNEMVRVAFNRPGTEQLELVPTADAQAVLGSLAGWGFQYTTGNKANNTVEFFDEAAELPVELTSFQAQVDGRDVVLAWHTASETNNAYFEIQGLSKNGGDGWQVMGGIEGHGTTERPQAYLHRVTDLAPGAYRFRLKQVDFDGTFAYSPEVEAHVALPGAYTLSTAYPNPFNARAQFTLMVAAAQHARVEVYDVTGRRVALLHDGVLAADALYRFAFEARNLPSGLYLYRVTAERFTAAQSMLLVR